MKVRQRYFWMNDPHDRPLPRRPLIVDGFAGGGGASLGIERALGCSVDIAINHNEAAIAMHMANHPRTRHYCENIWDVDPARVTEGRPVGVAWFSPDCTHFSRARGEKPVSKKIRGLAGVVIRWARRARPAVIFVENVEEFLTWGPVDERTNRPIKEKAGTLFAMWVRSLKRCGYRVEWRSLVASDYGSPTTRKRLFIVARCDGGSINWPKPTHGGPKQVARDLKRNYRSSRRPWHTAADVIDWSLPCPSIFLTADEAKAWGDQRGCRPPKRPLADNTLARIAEGIRREVIETRSPFIVRCNHGGDHFRGQSLASPLGTITQTNEFALVRPFVASLQHGGSTRSAGDPVRTITASAKDCNLVVSPLVSRMFGNSIGNDSREPFLARHFGGMIGREIEAPYPTITARPTQNQLVAATLVKNNYGDRQCYDVRDPLRTIVAGGNHHAEVRAFLMRYYGSGGQWGRCDEPTHAITSKARLCLGIVLVDGEPWQIVDIGMRMLTPRELFLAQGFPPDYQIDVPVNGKPASKSAQVARCGNSVCPQVVEALVRANLPIKSAKRKTRKQGRSYVRA